MIHCNENPIYVFPEKELCILSPNFHSCVCERFIYLYVKNGTEAVQLIFWEYLFWIFGIVSLQCRVSIRFTSSTSSTSSHTSLSTCPSRNTSWTPPCRLSGTGHWMPRMRFRFWKLEGADRTRMSMYSCWVARGSSFTSQGWSITLQIREVGFDFMLDDWSKKTFYTAFLFFVLLFKFLTCLRLF